MNTSILIFFAILLLVFSHRIQHRPSPFRPLRGLVDYQTTDLGLALQALRCCPLRGLLKLVHRSLHGQGQTTSTVLD